MTGPGQPPSNSSYNSVAIIWEVAIRLANVVPVHKKGDKHLASNYRPISLTSTIIKVMERIIHQQLVAALEQHNLLDNCQLVFARNTQLCHYF